MRHSTMKSEARSKKEKKPISSEDEDYDSCSDNGSYESVHNGRRRQKQFSVLRSDSDGLRMKISAIRNKKETKPSTEVKSNNNNHADTSSSKRPISQPTIKRKLSSSSCCCTRSESDSNIDGNHKKEKLKKIRLKRKKSSTAVPTATDSKRAQLTTDSECEIPVPPTKSKELKQLKANTENLQGSSISSSDNELPALVSAAIKCVESGSDTENPVAAQPSLQYTSSLLHDFMVKTQMIGGVPADGENSSSKTTPTTPTISKRSTGDRCDTPSGTPSKRKRGRPKKKIELPPVSEKLPNGRVEQKEVVDVPKINVISLEKQMYATERVLYPPRSKKKTATKAGARSKSAKDDIIDPLWRKIDVNSKFRRPSLTGYKSDGGNTVCSKILAAKSGYVSDYGGVGHRTLSGYKSDASGKSRYSTRSCISRAKSCDFRCSGGVGGSRRKMRRKRRLLEKSRQKFGNVNEQECPIRLQLAELSLGQSNEGSSRESLNKPIIGYGQSKKYGEINRFIRTGEYFGRSRNKSAAGTVTDFAEACELGENIFARSSAFSTKSHKSQSRQKFLELPRDFQGLRSKIRSRRSSAISRCSTMSMCSRHSRKKRRVVDSKLITEIDILTNTFPVQCRIAVDKTTVSTRGGDKDKIERDKPTAIVQKAASKRNQKKRKPSESVEHHLSEKCSNDACLMPKRRHKKAGNNCPDEHKLPLKKRHYLLTPGEKAPKNAPIVETPAPAHPPPGVFEPSVELEIQINLPKEAMAIVTKSEIDSPKNILDPTEAEKFLQGPAKIEKVVETLLNRTGGNILLKRKRKKFNRTGFPVLKKKRRKVSSASETETKPIAPVPKFVAAATTSHETTTTNKEPTIVLRASTRETTKQTKENKEPKVEPKNAKENKEKQESKENHVPKDVKATPTRTVRARPKKEPEEDVKVKKPKIEKVTKDAKTTQEVKEVKKVKPIVATVPEKKLAATRSRAAAKIIESIPNNAKILLPKTKILNVRLKRTKTIDGKVIGSELELSAQRPKIVKSETPTIECSTADDLEQEPLPANEATPLLSTNEASDSSNSSSSKTKKSTKWKKSYLPAGLLSTYYKSERNKKLADKGEKSESDENDPAALQRSLLPSPPYCEKFFRRTAYDFLLPYDLWWAHTNSKLIARNTVPSWNYRKIRTNIYGDTRYNPSSDNLQICNCKSSSACGDDCLNRMVYTECSPANCPCGDRCLNRKIQKHEIAPGTERFMTTNKGWGVMANLPIKKGTYIMEYVGEVVAEREFKDRMATLYMNDTHHYCLHLDGGLVIDGHRMGSDARFVNHSCSPNCEMQKWSVNGLFRMALFAMRDIEPGEELTYDYNFSLFNPAEGQPCRCDTPQCRGVIGGKSQRIKPLEPKPIEPPPANRHGRPRKRAAKKNSGRIQSKDIVVPQLQVISDRERKIIRLTQCFLMRNLDKVRRLKTKTIIKAEETPSRPITPSSLVVQISALRNQRNIKTRGLTQAAHDPEVEKMAKIAVILQAICAELENLMDSSGKSHLSKLIAGKKKKRTIQSKDKPIDFATIRTNIETGLYKQVEMFDSDMIKFFDQTTTAFESNPGVLASIEALKTAYITNKIKYYSQLAELVDDSSLIAFRSKEQQTPQKSETKSAEDIIRCICGLFRDEGLMIQCSKCFVWQHIECTKADPKAEHYLCDKCDSRVVDYEIPLNEYTDDGHRYYLSLMRGDLQVREGDTVYVLRDIPMKDESGKIIPSKKHTYETIGSIEFSECDIFRVEKLWKNAEGKRVIYGHHYLRPHETFHEPSRKFYENEVIRVPYYEVVPIELVMARCWVFDRNTYCKGRPIDCHSEEHVYICELRVDKSARFFARAKQAYPTCTKNYAFRKFKEKMKVFKTYAPHEVDPSFLKLKKRRSNEDVVPVTSKKLACPIVQLVPPPLKTISEKRTRLESILENLKFRNMLSNEAAPSADLSYLLTGRGARHRRATAAVVPNK